SNNTTSSISALPRSSIRWRYGGRIDDYGSLYPSRNEPNETASLLNFAAQSRERIDLMRAYPLKRKVFSFGWRPKLGNNTNTHIIIEQPVATLQHLGHHLD